ncbi:hypothetical protein RND71_038608 [Anisodus tanguticus]|uniref:Uncharacterized protein n=1 Tax=Anisodus tanguticus TaxID=243964 RepID=A0AAE1R2J5_9SOLA|nr:hypothetical protein RND71_038608 [Anisodus tanguticus]
MDETGVHSLLNAKKPIVPGIGTTSPVQTVAGKDSSNPLVAVTLPKSEHEEATSSQTRRRLPQTFTGSTSRARSKQTKKKPQKNIEQIIKDTLEELFKNKNLSQNSPPEQTKHVTAIELTELTPVPTLNPEQNSDYAQDAQDPNDYDSGMSFDSVARHNLDT